MLIGLATSVSLGVRRRGFNPLTHANLKLWVEMDSGVKDASGNPITDGGNVGRVVNQASTGSTYDLVKRTGDTASNLPTYRATGGQRGKPYLSFDGTTDRLMIANTLSFTGDFTIACLARPIRLGGSQPVLFGSQSSASKVQFTNFKALALATDSASASYDGTTTQAVGTLDSGLHLYVLKRSGSTVSWYVDTMKVATATLSGTFTLDMLGWASGAAFMLGDVYWFAAWDAALAEGSASAAPTGRQVNEDYIRSKYDHAWHLILLGIESTHNCTLTAGVDSSTGVAGQLLTQLRSEGYTNYVLYVEAVVGSTLAQAETRATANGTIVGIDNRDYTRFRETPVYLCWCAGNDVSSGNVTTLSRVTSYVNNRYATGKYGPIIGGTLYMAMAFAGDTNAASGSALLQSWNTYLKANRPTNMVSIADIGAQTHLSVGADVNDATYYVTSENPTIHLQTAGNTIVKTQWRTAINSYLVADGLAA